jgi:hypothetical protein
MVLEKGSGREKRDDDAREVVGDVPRIFLSLNQLLIITLAIVVQVFQTVGLHHDQEFGMNDNDEQMMSIKSRRWTGNLLVSFLTSYNSH